MAANTTMQVTPETNIPTGSWTLYFHATDETKWNLDSFQKIGSVKTWNEFWLMMEKITPEIFARGMFFWMRDPLPPLWENKENIRGGNYSIRVSEADIPATFMRYAIAAMLGQVFSAPDTDNRVQGFSIAPKRGFSVLKVWNQNADRWSDPADLQLLGDKIKREDVMYAPFVTKRF